MSALKFESAPIGPLQNGYKDLNWYALDVFSAASSPELASGITSGDQAIVCTDRGASFSSENGAFGIKSLELSTPGWTGMITIVGVSRGFPETTIDVQCSGTPTKVVLDWTSYDEMGILRRAEVRDPSAPHSVRNFVVDDIVLGSRSADAFPVHPYHPTQVVSYLHADLAHPFA